MRRSTIFSSVLLLLARNVRAGCYFADGTIDKNSEYQPCSKDASNPLSTICCATNRQDGADICAPNGLCQVGHKRGSPPADAAWTKPSCTNADWSKDGCLHVCGDDKYPFLTPCNRAAGNESARWCCGMSQNCCNEESNLSIEFLPIEFDPKNFTHPSSSSSISSSASSSEPTSSATKGSSPSSSSSPSAASTTAPAAVSATSSPSPKPATGLSTGSKAGIGIGASAGALFLVGLGIWYGRVRHNQRAAPTHEGPFEKNATVYAHYGNLQDRSSRDGTTAPPTPSKDTELVQMHEMPVFENRKEWEENERLRSGMIEMDTKRDTKELYG